MSGSVWKETLNTPGSEFTTGGSVISTPLTDTGTDRPLEDVSWSDASINATFEIVAVGADQVTEAFSNARDRLEEMARSLGATIHFDELGFASLDFEALNAQLREISEWIEPPWILCDYDPRVERGFLYGTPRPTPSPMPRSLRPRKRSSYTVRHRSRQRRLYV